MANYRKSFNLRNGVQVDDDNFFVNANGLVGIGTSVPTEILDVRGNATISGLVTARNIQSPNLYVTGIGTVALLNVGVTSITSGVITSTNPGVNTVKYYGDGSGLTNIPTSQWININLGLGFTSIYAAGTVGIATTSPIYYLQIGQNPDSGNGTGINSTGSIKASGIITAGYFSGDGSSLTGLNASNISSGTLSNLRLPSNINVSGVITATSGFVGTLTGTATTAQGLTGSPNITVTNITATDISASNANLSGIATASSINATNANLTGIITASSIRSGISSIGISTVYTRLYAESIGVGTNSPSSDIHVRRTSTSTLQLTSDSAEAIVAIGRSTTLAGNNGALRFGNTSGLYPYSSTKSLDIINYGTGNLNNYLSLGTLGVGTGNFNWFYALNPLMTLTYGGNLGIGITIPLVKLHIVGTSTATGSVYAGTDLIAANNIYAGTNLTVGNNLTVSGSASFASLSANLTGNVTGNLTGNVNGSGLSTFFQATVNSKIGIGTIASTYLLEVGSTGNRTLINPNAIGINTDSLKIDIGLDASSGSIIAGGIGIGTTSIYPLSVVINNSTSTSGLSNAIADFTNSVNSYSQINIRNSLSGTNASSDVIVTADTGTDTTNFLDLGINNSGFNTSTWTVNGAVDGYLYTSNTNLSIGVATNTKYLSFFAGGTLIANEAMRVTGVGSIGIGTTNPTSKVTINGDTRVGFDTSSGVILTSANGTKYRLIVSNAGVLSTILVP